MFCLPSGSRKSERYCCSDMWKITPRRLSSRLFFPFLKRELILPNENWALRLRNLPLLTRNIVCAFCVVLNNTLLWEISLSLNSFILETSSAFDRHKNSLRSDAKKYPLCFNLLVGLSSHIICYFNKSSLQSTITPHRSDYVVRVMLNTNHFPTRM